MSYNIFREEKFVLHSMIDRFWLKYQKDKIEISVGRQRVNWGVNTIWNNNDLFNAYNFIDFDYIERPGSDVIRFIYTGDNLSSFELVYLPSERKGYSLAGLYKLNSFGYDFQILAANYFEDKADIEAACFFYTQALVMALEENHDLKEKIIYKLEKYGRSKDETIN